MLDALGEPLEAPVPPAAPRPPGGMAHQPRGESFAQPAAADPDGGYALLYHPDSRPPWLRPDHWVGRDLGATSDEFDFYEELRALLARGAARAPGWRFLRWVLEYGGTCALDCDDGAMTVRRRLMLLRNLRSGMGAARCARLTLAQDELRAAALDGGGSVHGLRVPQGAAEGVAAEGTFQWLAALPPDPAPLPTDRFSAAEVAAAALRSAAQQLAALVAEVTAAAVPQLWMRSAAVVLYDAAARPSRSAPLPAAEVRLVGWGASAVVTPAAWHQLPAGLREQRRRLWAEWVAGAGLAAFEAARAWRLRYCPAQGWLSAEIRVWAHGTPGDACMGSCTVTLGADRWEGELEFGSGGCGTVRVIVEGPEQFPTGSLLASRRLLRLPETRGLPLPDGSSVYAAVTARDAEGSCVSWQSAPCAVAGGCALLDAACEFCVADSEGRRVEGELAGAVGDLQDLGAWQPPFYGASPSTVQAAASAFADGAAAAGVPATPRGAASPAAAQLEIQAVSSVESEEGDWDRHSRLLRELHSTAADWRKAVRGAAPDSAEAAVQALRHVGALARTAQQLRDVHRTLVADLCEVAVRHRALMPPGSPESSALQQAAVDAVAALAPAGAGSPQQPPDGAVRGAADEVSRALLQGERLREGRAAAAAAEAAAAERALLRCPAGTAATTALDCAASQVPTLLRCSGRRLAATHVAGLLADAAGELRQARAARAAAEAELADYRRRAPLGGSRPPPSADPYGLRGGALGCSPARGAAARSSY
eukprot:TRINITY_DN11407_c0_g1_i1.p1 TRINITY_DN11407_c0_g1~~TRINITY_DN11407_c0_g1_i1.p1  ORF type:complete len:792 (+),score=206.23 TRINITY_DN11407_c0_g1_i1:82-2376(+)